MSGIAPPTPSPPPERGVVASAGVKVANPSIASEVNRARIQQVANRLSEHFQSNGRNDPNELFQLCFALARGIDFAVSHGDIPPNTNNLPPVIKQAYNRRAEAFLQPAVMVLLISVKNACKNGWFLHAESDELLGMACEIANTFCWANCMISEESHTLEIASVVTSRFYPQLKLSRIFASFAVKSGYEILVADIYIPRNINREERIHLFVAQTDNMDTSNCIITPPQVNFMINGKGVDKRTNVSMESGPQFPSDITKLLKFGMNLFQAIGSFHGNYVISIGVMTPMNNSDAFVLQDYIKPVVSAVELDSEIIEGASRISLNCPISFKRIRTPVKGHLCKHHQCFDFENYNEMNSRKPSWRCPHCNQSVSYTDIRIDRFMEKILKESGDDISDIIISADGTWEAFVENMVNSAPLHTKALPDEFDGIPNETLEPFSSTPDVVDLTVEDYLGVDADDSGRLGSPIRFTDQGGQTPDIEEMKVPQNKLGDVPITFRSDLSSTGSAVHGASQISREILSSESPFTPVTDDQMWSSLPAAILESSNPSLLNPSRFDVLPSSSNYCTSSSSHDTLIAIPASTAFVTHLQEPLSDNSINTSEERRPIPRNVSRVPIAVQALPAQSQYDNPYKKARVGENNGFPNILDSSRSEDNSISVSGAVSQAGFVTEVIGPSQRQGGSGAMSDRSRVASAQSSHTLQSSQTFSHFSSPIPRFIGLPARSAAQGLVNARSGIPSSTQDNLLSAEAVSLVGSVQRTQGPPQASRASPLGEQELPSTALPQSLHRSDALPDPVFDKNWRPTGRMRGSLTGSAYSDALRHYSEQPTLSPRTPGLAVNPLSARAPNDSTRVASVSNRANMAGRNPSTPS